MTDPIADLLIRIKNASLAKKFLVIMPFSKLKLAILTILEQEGFLKDVKATEVKKKKMIEATIVGNISHVKQISKPGRRVYVKSKDIPKPLRGLGLVILSTPDGITTSRQAIKKGIGGELICEIW